MTFKLNAAARLMATSDPVADWLHTVGFKGAHKYTNLPDVKEQVIYKFDSFDPDTAKQQMGKPKIESVQVGLKRTNKQKILTYTIEDKGTVKVFPTTKLVRVTYD